MITLTHYWMGRELTYAHELDYDTIANANVLLERVNALLDAFTAETGITIRTVASGWRPKGVNEATANAAASSRHLTGEAIDLRDTADRDLARWCLRNIEQLTEIGLWMEDPQWTPTWVHLQIRPPGSGRRVYVPSTRPPLVAKLPEQGGVA